MLRLLLILMVAISCIDLCMVSAQDDVEYCLDLLRSGSSKAKSQGPPGKRGPVGEVGPVGDKGSKGDTGHCECDENRIGTIDTKLNEFKKHMEQFFKYMPISEKVRLCEVGIKSGSVPDSSITASSYWNNHIRHEPRDGRLDGPTNSQSAGCWAVSSDSNPWIQVALTQARLVTGVVTQGRARDYVQWVTRYKVKYGQSEDDLTFVTNDKGIAVEFDGNVDRSSYALTTFDSSILARIIRIYPTKWHGAMCMRFGVVTC